MSQESSRSTSDADAIPVVGIGFVVLVVLSVLVGFVGSPETKFDWTLASVFGTAVGTTALAGATGWLAWSTRSEVRATQRLAELTQEQQAATDRPVVLQVNAGWGGSPESGILYVVLRNVGLGPALRVKVGATYDGHADWQPGIGEMIVPVMMPGEERSIELPAPFPDIEHEPPAGVRGDRFKVAGSYLDRSRRSTYEIITSWPESMEPK